MPGCACGLADDLRPLFGSEECEAMPPAAAPSTPVDKPTTGGGDASPRASSPAKKAGSEKPKDLPKGKAKAKSKAKAKPKAKAKAQNEKAGARKRPAVARVLVEPQSEDPPKKKPSACTLDWRQGLTGKYRKQDVESEQEGDEEETVMEEGEEEEYGDDDPEQDPDEEVDDKVDRSKRQKFLAFLKACPYSPSHPSHSPITFTILKHPPNSPTHHLTPPTHPPTPPPHPHAHTHSRQGCCQRIWRTPTTRPSR